MTLGKGYRRRVAVCGDSHDSTDFCLQRGLLVTPTKNAVVRLLPSLLLTQEEWREGVSRLESALGMLAATQLAVVSPGGLR